MTIHPVKRFGTWAVVVPVGTIYFVLVVLGTQAAAVKLGDSGFLSQSWADFLGRKGFLVAFLSFIWPLYMIDWIWSEKKSARHKANGESGS
jgi:hypothetical protein